MIVSPDSMASIMFFLSALMPWKRKREPKYDAGGNILATNYESAILRLLTVDAVSEGKREESAYRKYNFVLTCGLN